MLSEQWMRNSYHNQLCGCWRLSGTRLGRLRFPSDCFGTGACCFPDGTYVNATQASCAFGGGVFQVFPSHAIHALSFANRSLLPWRLVHLFGGSNLSGCRGRVQRQLAPHASCGRVHRHRRLLFCRCLLHQRNAGKLLLWWRYFGAPRPVCHRLPPGMLCWVFLCDHEASLCEQAECLVGASSCTRGVCSSPCPGDFNSDSVIGFDDLLFILSVGWHTG